MARPLLPEKTRNKVKIFGSNWREEVVKIAVPETLPTFWNEPGEDVSEKANYTLSDHIQLSLLFFLVSRSKFVFLVANSYCMNKTV